MVTVKQFGLKQRSQTLLLALVAAFGGIALFALTWLFGVSPLLTTTITLCLIIILLTGFGCSLHLKEIERLQVAEESFFLKQLAAEQMQMIAELVENFREPIVGFEAVSGKLPQQARHDLSRARALLDALDQRFHNLLLHSSNDELQDLRLAGELAQSPIQLPTPDTQENGESEALSPEVWQREIAKLLEGAYLYELYLEAKHLA